MVMPGGWLKIALFVSVAINLLVAGVAAGQYFGRPHGPPPGGLASGGPPGRLLEGLTSEQRRVVEDAFAKRRTEMQAARRSFGEARAWAAEILGRPTFDEPAMTAALGQVRSSGEGVQRVLHEATIEAARSLPPEARRKLAEAGRRPRPPARRDAP